MPRARLERLVVAYRRPKRVSGLTAVIALAVLVGSFAAAGWVLRDSTAVPRLVEHLAPVERSVETVLHDVLQNRRPVYPYSVVRGGVFSAGEVKQAVEKDPVVARHYAGIQTDKLGLQKLTQDRAAYVSYRIGDKVYWTAKPVKLSAGEYVLSDGANVIRARCGNRLSESQEEPVSVTEEPVVEAVLDSPMEPEEVSLPPVMAQTVDPVRRERRLPPLAIPEISPPLAVPIQAGTRGIPGFVAFLPAVPVVAVLLGRDEPTRDDKPLLPPETPQSYVPPVTEIPEPGFYGVLALGLGALAFLARRRARA
jgi:hypothetical protein